VGYVMKGNTTWMIDVPLRPAKVCRDYLQERKVKVIVTPS
jgi:hypothetical protein